MKQFLSQHKVRIGFIALLLVVFTAIGFNLFYNELRKRSKAAPTGTPVVTYEAWTDPPEAEGRGIVLKVRLDPNGSVQDLYSFDMEVKFDASKLEFYQEGGLEGNFSLYSDILKQQVSMIGEDTIRIIGTKTTNPFTADNQEIAKITLKLKNGQNLPVTFSWGKVVLETSNFVKEPITLGAITSSSSSAVQTADEVKLSFSSDQEKYRVGDTVKVDLFVASGNKQFASVGAGFVFDPAILEYKSASVDTSSFDQTAVVVPPPNGESFISVNAARKASTKGSYKVATVIFSAKAQGTANFAYTKDKSSVYTADSTNILTAVQPYSVSVTTITTSSSSSSTSSVIPSGVEEETAGTLLHINSNASYPSPFKYEQTMSLESTQYVLSGLARVYTARGRGVQLLLMCGETDCNNGKKKGDVIVTLPFATSPTFRRQEKNFEIINGPKKYTLRLLVEDGSEVDFDYISIKNVWDGELVENWHFEKKTSKSFPRAYPEGWDFDENGLMYGGLYKQTDAVGKEGVLFINSPSR